MTSINQDIIHIFHPPDVQAPVHWVSDLTYWKNLFHTEAEINKKHKQDVMRLIKENVASMKQYAVTSNDSRGDAGDVFMEHMKAFINRLTTEKKEYSKAAKDYLDMENSLQQYQDKLSKRIASYEKQLNYLNKKLEHLGTRIDKVKKNYHKARFTAEKQAVKVRLCLKPDVEREAKKKGDKAAAKANTMYNKYQDMIKLWNKMAEDARLVSMEYEGAYVDRELERTELVMEALKRLEIPRNKRTNKNYKFGPYVFDGIDVRDMIEHHATSDEFMKVIECPKLQEYDPSKELISMYEHARRELAVEEADHTEKQHDGSDSDLSSDFESDDEEVEVKVTDGEVSKKLANDRKFKYFVVTSEYKKQDVTEINLKLGERVKLLLPANEHGLAFGEVKHGILKKKKKGFYPVDHTKLVTTLNAENAKVNERKLKMAHKFQKKVKKTKTKTSKSCTHVSPKGQGGHAAEEIDLGAKDQDMQSVNTKKARAEANNVNIDGHCGEHIISSHASGSRDY